MVTRQRPRKPTKSSRYAVGGGGQSVPKQGFGSGSRLPWLLCILALTTTLFVALQVHRRGGGGTGISSIFHSGAISQRGRDKGIGGIEDESKLDEMRKTIAALSKQFQKEFGSLSSSSSSSSAGEGDPNGAGQDAALNAGQSAGMAVVPGEGVVDHGKDINANLQNAPHVEGKSQEEAEEDKRVGLEDLDQDTLKAMFDLLYARD